MRWARALVPSACALALCSCLVEGRIYNLEVRNSTDDVVVVMEGRTEWTTIRPGASAMYAIGQSDGCSDGPALVAVVDGVEVARRDVPVCEGLWEITAGSTAP